MEDLPFANDEPPSPNPLPNIPPRPYLGRPKPSLETIGRILALPSFGEQVDEFAQLHRSHTPNAGSHSYAAINAYLASEITAEEAVRRIAEPIEEAYTTADHGWGLADETKRQTRAADDGRQSSEGYLWDLYYSFLHAARRIPWEKEAEKLERLVKLMKMLQARPDPDPCFKHMEIVVHSWVLNWEGLWSTLAMFGPSSRESWNDSPGCGAGMEEPEIQAWANVNAFMAQVVRDGMVEYWSYSIWSLREALEWDDPNDEKYRNEAYIPAAAAWILLAGEKLYERDGDLILEREKIKKKHVHKLGRVAKLKLELFGAMETETQAHDKERWRLWSYRFQEVAADWDDMKADTRRLAQMAYEHMEEIEQKAAESAEEN